jgi:hypothetical protein
MKRMVGSRKMQLSSGMGIFACVPGGLLLSEVKQASNLFGAQYLEVYVPSR